MILLGTLHSCFEHQESEFIGSFQFFSQIEKLLEHSWKQKLPTWERLAKTSKDHEQQDLGKTLRSVVWSDLMQGLTASSASRRLVLVGFLVCLHIHSEVLNPKAVISPNGLWLKHTRSFLGLKRKDPMSFHRLDCAILCHGVMRQGTNVALTQDLNTNWS